LDSNTPTSESGGLVDRVARLHAPIMIRGDRLLLALSVLEFVYLTEHFGDDQQHDRGFSPQRMRKGTLNRVGHCATFPPIIPIFFGIHRGGESIGLATLLTTIARCKGLERVEFNWNDIESAFLNQWTTYAPWHERIGLQRWIAQIAAGELTEDDFKENAQ
jgi:hypothetical protein